MNQQQIPVRRPSRDHLRMIFDNNAKQAITTSGREAAASVIEYHEYIWAKEDEARAAAEEERKKKAQEEIDKKNSSPPPDDPPTANDPPPNVIDLEPSQRTNGKASK